MKRFNVSASGLANDPIFDAMFISAIKAFNMTPKLTSEQRDAIERSGGPVAVEDEATRRIYFLIDESTMESLQRQQDIEAIREGIADIEAGQVAPLDEVMARIRANLGLPRVS